MRTADDMSLADFIEETKFMAEVNAAFPRPFVPNESRPRLQRLDLSQDQIDRLRDLFFDPDGSLRDSIQKEVDSSAKHGYINFNNTACRKREDSRWQVPIRKHGCGKQDTKTSHDCLLTESLTPQLFPCTSESRADAQYDRANSGWRHRQRNGDVV